MAIEIAIGGDLEVYDTGGPTDLEWAKVRCTNGAAPDWTTEIETDGDGFATISGIVTSPHEQGFQLRWNASPSSYSLLVLTHGGGGGQAYGSNRGVDNGSTDWEDLESRGCRIVDIKWFNPSPPGMGKWTRPSTTPITFNDIDDRTVQILEWIDENLNTRRRPIAAIGSSGGADSLLAPFAQDAPVARMYRALIMAPYPVPFWKTYESCHEITDPGTFVNKDTGYLTNDPADVGSQQSGLSVIEYLRTDDKCELQTITELEAADNSDADNLAGLTAWYRGLVMCAIGQVSDVPSGHVWSSGNLLAYGFWALARRRWFSSATDDHGEALSDVTSQGFAQVHAELAALAALGGSMTLQFSVAVRNAMLDAIEAVLIAAGNDAILEIRTGAPPANCAAADSGTVLATIALPDDPFAAAGSGSKAKSGTWQDASADNTGTAAHFRVKDHAGACQIQGTVTATGGGGDMEVQNTSFVAGQQFTVTGFTVTAGNA